MARKVSEEKRRAYKAFLASGVWKAIRQAALYRAGNLCEWCKCSGESFLLHVHHKTYARFGGMEEPTDLQVLCDGCHAEAHGKPYLLCKTTKKERAERKARVKANRPKTPEELAKERKRANKRAKQARYRARRLESTSSLKDRF